MVGDAEVEIDGSAVGEVTYGRGEGDGTTRRLVVRGADLVDLLTPGRTLEVVVRNPLTGLRSAPISFTVPVG